MNRKIAALVAAVVGVAACGPAWAGWPDDKPVEVVIGFAPGGATDVMARKLLPTLPCMIFHPALVARSFAARQRDR